MSYVKVWVHYVWSTKHREPFLATPALRKAAFRHLRIAGREQGIHVDHVSGYTDHVHALVSLEPMQSVAGVAQFMKMESSRWLKEQQFVPDYFAWQTDYFAVSVSESMLGRVRAYIRNQETHHQQQTFGDEHDQLLSRWEFG